MPQWSPAQYLKFANERTHAARDLLAQVPGRDARLLYDLGCGPSNCTGLLIEAFPTSRVVGVDSCVEMLAKARKALPNCEFVQADLESWAAPADVDLLYSNATFQCIRLRIMLRMLTN